MKKIKTLQVLLIAMIIASIFTGAPIKGWVFLYEFELELLDPLVPDGQYIYGMATIFALTSHLIIFAFPFILQKRSFKHFIIFTPLVYVLSLSFISGLITLILIPFILFWIAAMIIYFKK